MKEVLAFLSELNRNNNKEWFDANKDRYKKLRAYFDDFTGKLIAGMGEIDPQVRGLEVKDCVYRIYRDVRFSNNKDPYKTHLSAYICRGGKNSGYAGYYFHVQPKVEGGMMDGNYLTSGIYMAESPVMKSIRTEIVDNGGEFMKTVRKSKGFHMAGEDEKLKRVPNGFPADSPYAEYLKMKHLYLGMQVDDEFMTAPGLLERTLAEFKKTVDFNHFLNRAIELAKEDM